MNELNHRLGNITKLRATMVGIFVFTAVIALFFGEGITAILHPALLVINAGIILVPYFITQYGSQGTFNPMTTVKGNMIISFINIGATLIMFLAGDGNLLGLVIHIPDFLLLTQVKMIYNLANFSDSDVKHSPNRNDNHSESFDNRITVTANTNTATGGNGYKVGQTVFARWDNGASYFPGIVSAINGSQLDISFLDGDNGTVPIGDVLELHEAFTTLKLHGNYQNGGEWYSGKISKTEPLTMQYDDGDVEQIELKQLRGVL